MDGNIRPEQVIPDIARAHLAGWNAIGIAITRFREMRRFAQMCEFGCVLWVEAQMRLRSL
jgi:hypothetical protein